MALINFAVKGLGTEITCDKVCSDGYEPENLLRGSHTKSWAQCTGFLAERFIKPPVTLTLKFPCPVSISHIVLDTQVGSQRSSVVEIYTACQKAKWIKLVNCDFPCLNKSDKTNSTPPSADRALNNVKYACTEIDAKEKDCTAPELVFTKIGIISCPEQGRICFRNSRFKTKDLYSDKKSGETTHFQYVSELYHHQWEALAAADYMSIRIVRTIGGSVAAIGHLEIWGQPAQSSPQPIKMEIFSRYAVMAGKVSHNTILGHAQQSSVSESNLKKTLEGKMHASDSSGCLETAVPDEFFDSLTCEVMSVPVLLPSGHTLDLSSLDRFAEIEASHGRLPSDPFTGLAFSETRRPVPNTDLKSRIDRFLLEHPNEPSLKNVPRALNRGPLNLDQAYDTKSHIHSMKQTIVTKEHKTRKKLLGDITCTNNYSDLKNVCSKVVGPSFPKKAKLELSEVEHDSSHKTAKICSPDSHTHTGGSYESLLKSSLNDSLMSLQHLPSFTKIGNLNSTARKNHLCDNKQCAACSASVVELNELRMESISDTSFYELECKHLMCRKCVISITTGKNNSFIICPVCHKHSVKSDVVKKHV